MIEINQHANEIDLKNSAFFIDIADINEPLINKTLLEQIIDRYSDLTDLNGSFSYSLSYKSKEFIRDKIETPETNKSDPIDESEINIDTKNSPSPRKSVIASVSIVLNDKQIKCVGDTQELEKTCVNVQELDLSKNDFSNWDEIKKILISFKKLRLLNLSSNPLSNACDKLPLLNEGIDKTQLVKEYFNKEWNDLYFCVESPRSKIPIVGPNLNTLILATCYIDLIVVECILDKLKSLNELHLSNNRYEEITFSSNFSHESLKILFFNSNSLKKWTDVERLGECFPSLEHLVISDNKINDFGKNLKEQTTVFKNVHTLVMNKFNITDWNCVEFSQFPQLKHIRLQNIQLLEKYDKNKKYELLVGHLSDTIETLNGGKFSRDEKKSCELKYLYHFSDSAEKSNRYFELLFKHKAFNISYNLVNDNKKVVLVRILCNGKRYYEKLNTDLSLIELKEALKKISTSQEFRIFKILPQNKSVELNGVDPKINLKDGDELTLEL